MIRCIRCGKVHEKGSEDYFSIHGNIYIGDHGGVVGNNFPTFAREIITKGVVSMTYFCLGCFRSEVDGWIEMVELNKRTGNR